MSTDPDDEFIPYYNVVMFREGFNSAKHEMWKLMEQAAPLVERSNEGHASPLAEKNSSRAIVAIKGLLMLFKSPGDINAGAELKEFNRDKRPLGEDLEADEKRLAYTVSHLLPSLAVKLILTSTGKGYR